MINCPVTLLKLPMVHRSKLATVFILHEYSTVHKAGEIVNGFNVKIAGALDPVYA